MAKCPYPDSRCFLNKERGVCCWECPFYEDCKFICFDSPNKCGRLEAENKYEDKIVKRWQAKKEEEEEEEASLATEEIKEDNQQ